MPWKQIIENAKSRGYFTAYARHRANYISTCAVGEKLNLRKHPNPYEYIREHDSEDDRIHDLSFEFWKAVDVHEVGEAERIYKEIQALSAPRFFGDDRSIW